MIIFNMITFQGEGGDYTGGLYALRPGQENPRQLTTNPWDYDPSFAPSGKELVFRRTNTPRPGIYTLDLRNKKTTRLTPQADVDPAFGPRGMVVFSRFAKGNRYDLFLRAQSGRLRRLTSTPANDKEAVFTPDGERIIFSRDRGLEVALTRSREASPTEGLYSIRIDGTGLRKIGEFRRASGFDTSPDGRHIVFEETSGIRTKRLDGGGSKFISGNAKYPSYSPAGDKIAYSNYDGLWMRRADGRGGRTLVLKTEYAPYEAGAQLIVQPAWQPLP